jgi:hypothetical protein
MINGFFVFSLKYLALPKKSPGQVTSKGDTMGLKGRRNAVWQDGFVYSD